MSAAGNKKVDFTASTNVESGFYNKGVQCWQKTILFNGGLRSFFTVNGSSNGNISNKKVGLAAFFTTISLVGIILGAVDAANHGDFFGKIDHEYGAGWVLWPISTLTLIVTLIVVYALRPSRPPEKITKPKRKNSAPCFDRSTGRVVLNREDGETVVLRSNKVTSTRARASSDGDLHSDSGDGSINKNENDRLNGTPLLNSSTNQETNKNSPF